MAYMNDLNKSQLAAVFADLMRPLNQKIDRLTEEVIQLKKDKEGIKDEFLSTKEVQELLGISRGSVNNYVNEGKFIKYKVGKGKVVFKRIEVLKFIELTKK